MDANIDKKWFVYVGDHHEGPLTLMDIQAKMAQGQVTRSSFVWCEGMTDWKPMPEVSAFDAILSAKIETPAAPKSYSSTDISIELSEPTLSPNGEVILRPEAPSAAGVQKPVLLDNSPNIMLHAVSQKSASGDSLLGSESKKLRSKSHRFFAFVATLAFFIFGISFLSLQGYLNPVMQSPTVKAITATAGDTLQPYLQNLALKYPSLGTWVSPIARVDDISAEEFEELKSAARVPWTKDGAKAAFAVSKEDPFAPKFYVASNLPDGANFTIYALGVSETLLNHLSFSGVTTAQIHRKLGKSGPLKYPDGKAIPRGFYQVFVTESDAQVSEVKSALSATSPSSAAPDVPEGLPRDRKIILKKTLFLGGPKDDAYQTRLKEYHDKLRAKAQSELSELKQLSSTLETQLQDTVAQFPKIRRMRPGKPMKTAWADFHNRWSKLDATLANTMQKWTPDSFANEFFYGTIYQATLNAAAAIQKLHATQANYFSGKTDRSFDIQLGEAVSGAQTLVSTMKAKIDAAEKLTPTATGMPRRDGL